MVTPSLQDELSVEVADGEARLGLNRPRRRNAISAELFVRIRQAIARFGTDDDVRVIVLRSTVAGIFSAGADVGTLADPAASELQRQFGLLVACIDEIRRVPKPVVAVIEGDSLGAGCALAAAADFVVADERVRFSLPEIHLDLAPVLAMAALFPVVNARKLVYWAATGRAFAAQDACDAGLVTLVAAPGDIDRVVAELLSDLKRPSSFTLATLKRASATLAAHLTDETHGNLMNQMLATATHPSTQRAIRQFIDRKRKP
jgi:enoyl-CoA hydratase/carnithine racemase